MNRKCLIVYFSLLFFTITSLLNGCGIRNKREETRILTDQVGRKVNIGVNINRAAALHRYAGKILYALGLKDKLVHNPLSGKEAEVLGKVDKKSLNLPVLEKNVNPESLLKLSPEVVFTYSSFSTVEIERLNEVGLVTVGVKGESLDEAYETIEMMGEIFNCEDKADEYIKYIKNKYNYIKNRTKDIKEAEKPKVLITGPKSIYTVATGEMLQSEMIELCGGINVAKDIKGFWSEISPEQIVTWNPDYIFLGSSFNTNTIEDIYNSPAFSTVNAVHNKNIYIFPSNIGWWDFPLPQTILGMLWTAKTINANYFTDLDMKTTADEYYNKYFGYSFTELGGKLD